MIEHTQESIGNFFNSDANFNDLYPLNIRMLASRHWTSINIAKLAVGFLAGKGSKILDIGSGVGKFCLTGAYYAPNSQFFGVEQRESLVRKAVKAQRTLDLQNISFIHGNFTQLNLKDFDHFYFFNSFYENIDDLDRIDEDLDYSEALYEYYVGYLYNGLQQMPKGTKLVTYHSCRREIPRGYEVVESHQNGDLNFWIKK
jgi:SAM-dependent methyltransferase